MRPESAGAEPLRATGPGGGPVASLELLIRYFPSLPHVGTDSCGASQANQIRRQRPPSTPASRAALARSGKGSVTSSEGSPATRVGVASSGGPVAVIGDTGGDSKTAVVVKCASEADEHRHDKERNDDQTLPSVSQAKSPSTRRIEPVPPRIDMYTLVRHEFDGAAVWLPDQAMRSAPVSRTSSRPIASARLGARRSDRVSTGGGIAPASGREEMEMYTAFWRRFLCPRLDHLRVPGAVGECR